MKKFLIFALLHGLLLSASLTKYSTYNRDNYFDVLLNFNEPYSPQVKILRSTNAQAVVLGGLISDEKRELKVQSDLISNLLIYPHENNGQTSTVLEFKTKKDIKISVAITSNDGFALRVRVEPKAAAGSNGDFAMRQDAQGPERSIEFASDEDLSAAWVKMIITLVFIICVLFALKTWLKKSRRKKPRVASEFASKAAAAVGAKIDGAVILCEKALDENNRFVVLEYEGSRYKLIIGQGNIWLNQPTAPTPASENFEQYFLENQQRLSNLIRQKNLSDYKEKITHKKENS